MKLFRYLLWMAVAFMITASAFAQTNEPWIQDGKIYIKLKDQFTVPFPVVQGRVTLSKVLFLQDKISAYGITKMSNPFWYAKDSKLERTFLIEFSMFSRIDDLISGFAAENTIEYAEKVPIYKLFLTPNDTYYGNLTGLLGTVNGNWHLDAISAEPAWNISTGNPNVKVAVLDNGIYTAHPDLVNKVVAQIDLADGDNDPTPPAADLTWSHGTHTSGLVGAQTNNNTGVASIGYNTSLMAVKVGRDSDGALVSGFEGIVWAADHGADVISMSWGSKQYVQTMQNIVNYAYNMGCVLVAAAGNDGNDTIQYPAGLDHVISVASVDEGDGFSSFSCYGPWIDVCAPGGSSTNALFSVLSTTYSTASWIGAGLFGVSGQYDVMSGTSMSCPIVAGLCGLMLSVDSTLTPEKLENILKLTCDNIDAPNPGHIGDMGAGRVNAFHALQMIQDSMSTIVADFHSSATLAMVNDSISFFDQSTGSITSWNWMFPGGSPSSSNDTNPANIIYSAPGIYPVILTVSDGTNSNTETKTNFITVKASASSAWLPQATRFTAQSRGIMNISIVNPQIVWASAYDGSGGATNVLEFTRTVNGGITWVPGNIGIPAACSVSELFAINADTAWVATYGDSLTAGQSIYRTNDAGLTWTAQTTAVFQGGAAFPDLIYFWDANNGVTVGDPNNGYFEIYTTTDGGNNWIRVPQANIPANVSGEFAYAGGKDYDVVNDIIWFGTNKGNVYKSSDRGLHWVEYSTNCDQVTNLTFSDENNGIMEFKAVNGTGLYTTFIMKSTTNGGQTWSTLNYTGSIFKSDIDAVPGKPGMYVVTGSQPSLIDNGSAFSLDYGHSWTKIDDSVQYTCVKFYDYNTGWAGGFNLSATSQGIWKWMGLIQDSVNIIADFMADSTTIHAGSSVSFTDLSLGNVDNWSWSFTGGSPATSISQNPSNITYGTAGIYPVTLTASNPDTSVVKTKTTYIHVINSIGIDEIPAVGFSVYPNPADDNLWIKIKGEIQSPDIRILDIAGKCLVNESLGNVRNGVHFVKVSNLASGLYLLEIRMGREVLRQKISIR
jgi:subtilisin family serine protease